MVGDLTRNIVETWVLVGPGKYWLKESRAFQQDDSQQLPAFGALWLESVGQLLVCRTYATSCSPLDLLTGFPAEALLKDVSNWDSQGDSNGLSLKAQSERMSPCEGNFVVVTTFDFPADYSGPPYQTRRIWFDAKTLQIWKVAMTFQNGQTDIGTFSHYINGMKIDWSLSSGHLNQMNVNFF